MFLVSVFSVDIAKNENKNDHVAFEKKKQQTKRRCILPFSLAEVRWTKKERWSLNFFHWKNTESFWRFGMGSLWLICSASLAFQFSFRLLVVRSPQYNSSSCVQEGKFAHNDCLVIGAMWEILVEENNQFLLVIINISFSNISWCRIIMQESTRRAAASQILSLDPVRKHSSNKDSASAHDAFVLPVSIAITIGLWLNFAALLLVVVGDVLSFPRKFTWTDDDWLCWSDVICIDIKMMVVLFSAFLSLILFALCNFL